MLFASTVSADGLEIASNSRCEGNSDLLNTLTNLPFCIVENFFNYITLGLIATTENFVDSTFTFLFSHPNPRWFCTPYSAVMRVLESLFSILLMGLALFFILRSNDVEGRVTAKKWMENLILMIIVLAFSFTIFQLMLDFNQYLSTSLATDSMRTIFNPSGDFSSAIFALVMLVIIVSLMMLTFLTLLIRYILIPFLLLLFPISIFLYFIPLTKSWGKAGLSMIAIIVFMTTIDSLIILGLSALFNVSDPNLAEGLVRAFAVLFGFGALGIINVLLFFMAILSPLSGNSVVTRLVRMV